MKSLLWICNLSSYVQNQMFRHFIIKPNLLCIILQLYDLKRKNGFCFLWNETEGGLSSNEFSSIIIYFLQKYVINSNIRNLDSIILYIDGCTYQNRNSTLSNALLNLSINSNVTIIQKFLQRGHTQMEVDSMHSTIERKVRNKKINVPVDYISICKSACIKSPYTVEYLTHNFFKSFSSLNFCKSIRPGNKKADTVVTNLKAIKYEPDRQIIYKLRFTEEDWSTLKLKYSKHIAVKFDDLPQLHNDRLKIKKEKFEHLQQLKLTMEKDYHAFFDNLPKE